MENWVRRMKVSLTPAQFEALKSGKLTARRHKFNINPDRSTRTWEGVVYASELEMRVAQQLDVAEWFNESRGGSGLFVWLRIVKSKFIVRSVAVDQYCL